MLGLVLVTGILIGAPSAPLGSSVASLLKIQAGDEKDRREELRVGRILLTQPDGYFCRQMGFDNVTGDVREGAIIPCHAPPPSADPGERRYSWGRR